MNGGFWATFHREEHASTGVVCSVFLRATGSHHKPILCFRNPSKIWIFKENIYRSLKGTIWDTWTWVFFPPSSKHSSPKPFWMPVSFQSSRMGHHPHKPEWWTGPMPAWRVSAMRLKYLTTYHPPDVQSPRLCCMEFTRRFAHIVTVHNLKRINK